MQNRLMTNKMYEPRKTHLIKPQKFSFPIYMDWERYEIFCDAYQMFKYDDIERDIWVELMYIDERYISIWYKSAYRRDADYIRCLRYLLIEAYRTEFVFSTEEPILKLKHSINLKDDDDGDTEN